MSVTRFFASLKMLCAVVALLVVVAPIFAQIPDFPKPLPEVQALLDQARPLRNLNKIAEAEPLYQKALEKARSSKDKAGEAMTLAGYAVLLQRKDQLPESLKMLEQALVLAREAGAKSAEATAIQGLGSYYYSTGKPLQAAERFEEASKIFHAIGDKFGEAGMMMNLGIIYENTGDAPKAIAIYERVLPIFRERKDKGNEANVLTNLGKACSKIGKRNQAKSYNTQALTLYRALGDKSNEANILIGFIEYARDEGDMQNALKLGQEALEAARESKNLRVEALVLAQNAITYHILGQVTKALEIGNRALELARSVKDVRSEASILNGIAVIYSRIGEPQKAMELLQRTIQIDQGLGDKNGILNVSINLGYLASDMKRYTQAEVYFRSALSLAKELAAPGSRASALNGLAMVAKSQGNFPLALRHYKDALAISREQKSKEKEAAILGNIGNLFLDQKNYREARKFLTEGLAAFRQAGNRNGVSNVSHALGKLSQRDKSPLKETESYFRQAVTEARATGNRLYLAHGLNGLAEMAAARKDYAEAVKQSAAGIALLEEIRAALGGYTAAKAEFLSAFLSIYSDHLEFLLKAGREAEAFEFAQKVKARTLLDTLAYGRVDLSSVLTEEERQQEQTLHEKADGLNERMVQEGVVNEVGAKKRFAALKAELKTAEGELQTLTETLYARHPELSRRRVAQTATLTEMAKLIPADTVLLEYAALNSETMCVFVVTTERGKAQVRAITISAKEMQKQAEAFRLACSDPRKAWKPQARALYARLIAPAAKSLRGKTRLIICPDGVLWDVPFAALLKSERTLGSRYVLSSAYSATGMQAARHLAQERNRKRPQGSVLIVANPDFGTTKRFGDLNDLPGQRPLSEPSRPLAEPSRPLSEPSRPLAEPSRSISMQLAATVPVRGGYIASLAGTQHEADAIKALFPNAEVLTLKNAQETTVKAEAGKFRYLHFATHGFVNDAAPMLSSVVLAAPNADAKEDGFLTAREVYDLTLNAEMATLSACNTGRGETRSGEGIVGLTWALLCAGCPTQVVSQWSVDDAATAKLMGGFYGNLKAGKDKANALQTASRTLQSTSKYRHPYYWAAFVVMGEGR